MKETNINGKDYGFTNPWNKGIDVNLPDANEKIRKLGEISRSNDIPLIVSLLNELTHLPDDEYLLLIEEITKFIELQNTKRFK